MEVMKKFGQAVTGLVVRRDGPNQKVELKITNLKLIGISAFIVFVIVVLFLPEEEKRDFTTKSDTTLKSADSAAGNKAPDGAKQNGTTDSLWGAPPKTFAQHSATNYNTSMVLTPKNGNAKTQLRAGLRAPLRILEKFIVSDSAVPILAETIADVTTESGLSLPAGTKFYGEASHQKDMDRATIQFTQISLPSGEIKSISALALGKDSQPGVPGDLHSDSMKNTAGQMITTFVGGFAAGSMQTDFLGNSRGGVQNGLLNALAQTAKDRAQNYGEKLKNERQWIEVSQFSECDAAFTQPLNLQAGSDSHE